MPLLDDHIKEFQELVSQMENTLLKQNPELLTSTENVTVAQFATGLTLRNMGTLSMGELGQHIGVKLSNLTGIVDRLVKKKYVVRDRDENDRRLVKVRLTLLGKKSIDEIERAKHRHFKPIMKQLNESERIVFLTLLKKVVTGLKESSK